MIRSIFWGLFIKLFARKGGEIMMVIFFAQRVLLDKATFEAPYGDPKYIPDVLKQGVAEELINSGLGFVVPKEYGGTKE